MPLAATTYYFSSKDELIAEALASLIEDEIARLSERATEMGEALSSPRDAAAALTEVLFPDGEAVGRTLAQFEVYLAAARRPGLRASAAHWRRSFTELAETALRLGGAADPPRYAPLLVAGVDGIVVHELSAGIQGERGVEWLRARLEQLFGLVLAAD